MAPQPNNKRKRSNDKPGGRGKRTKEDLEAAVQDPEQQEASLKAYMFHANKLLHKACKKAKTFELQKLTRKIKTTREPKDNKPVDEAVLKDLESQLIALKALSIDPIPSHLLSTRLPKLPCLRSKNFLPSLISSIPTNNNSNLNWKELDGQSPEGKVRNRILANKTLTIEGWEEVVRAIRKRMGEIVESNTTTTTTTANTGTNTKATITMKSDDKGKGKETIDEAEKEEGGGEKRLSKRAERARKAEETKKNLPKRTMEMSAERKAALQALERGGRRDSEDENDEKDDDDDDDDGGPIAGSENELDDDEIERELAAMNEGLSGSEGDWSGSEDEEEDGFESDSSLPQQPRLKRTRLSASSSPPPPPPTTTKKSKIREIPTHKPVTSSAFLPSLASGYVSYSDSDGEDAKWVKAAEKESKKGERKNRRGQRARQAIWEKKYGQAAAHVVKASGGKPLPVDKLKKNKKLLKAGEPVTYSIKSNNNTTSKTVPTEEDKPFNPANAPGGSANPNAQPIASRKIGYGQQGQPTSTTTTPTGEKMHPSWEAKRKQAEALKQTQPQGKKITFD